MRKSTVLAPLLLLLVLSLASCGQTAEKLNNAGNEAFVNQDYAGALVAYQKAAEEAPELAEPYYNAANSHYRMEEYEQAQQVIEQALVGEMNTQDLDQSSLYNLGNTFFQTEQYEMAVEVYKEALRLKPDDLEAKQNLELALRQLEQQQQEQQNQDQQNQDQQDQENQDQQSQDQQEQQNQDQQDQENQDQQSQDQQDQESQDQQSQDQQDQQNQDQQDQKNQDQQSQDQQEQQNQAQQNQQEGGQPQDREQNRLASNQPQQAAGLSKEQARQLLEAAAQGTKSLEEALQQMLVFPGSPPLEDW